MCFYIWRFDMLAKTIGGIKVMLYKLLYRSSVQFGGIPSFQWSAGFKITKGKVLIGKYFGMKKGAYIAAVNGGEVKLGNNVSLNRNCMIICHDSIIIGDNCAIGPHTLIYDHDHKFGYKGIKSGFNTSPVEVENNCWIGAGVVILRGTHIGEGCIIGAGCVVKGDIPPHSLVTADRNLNIVPINF